MIVTDCSILVSGFLPDENNDFAEDILEQLMLDQ